MSYSVLIATPTAAFGDLIRHCLEDLGRFEVHVAHSAGEAGEFSGSPGGCAAILDGDLGVDAFRTLAGELPRRIAGLQLVLIPPDNDPRHSSLGGLTWAAQLSKPFYLPDLIDLMNRLADSLPALKPARLTAMELSGLLGETTALAALVLGRGGVAVQGGMLAQDGWDELHGLAESFWNRPARSDLIQFTRLEAAALDGIAYMTALKTAEEAVLLLFYPLQAPLSKVRAQAGVLAAAVSGLGLGEPADEAPSAVWAEAALAEPEPVLNDLSAGKAALPGLPFDEDAWGGEDSPLPDFDLAELLGAIPSPDPGGKRSARSSTDVNSWLAEWIQERDDGAVPPAPEAVRVRPAATDETPVDLDAEAPADRDDQRLRWVSEFLDAAQEEDSPAGVGASPLTAAVETLPRKSEFVPVGLDVWQVAPAETAAELAAAAEASAGEIRSAVDDDNHANVLTPLTRLDQLEPVSPALSLLNYTCVLVPRMPQHYLTGELSEKLTTWVHGLCVAYGWRLEGISLRPEYLQWTVQVSPNVPPGNVVKIIRQRSSEHIFAQFELLRKQNPSGDFWATGFLIVSGSQPPSAGLLRDFITQTRHRQGVARIPGDTPPRLSS